MHKLIFLLILTFLKTISSQYSSDDRPCFLQPLVKIANKNLYFAVHFKANYYQADNFCRSHCMSLVSIESEEIHNGIIKYIRESPYRNEDFWTSGNDLAEEGVYVWSATGKRMNYTRWVEGQPDNFGNHEHCIHLWQQYDYNFNDVTCSDGKFFYICQIN